MYALNMYMSCRLNLSEGRFMTPLATRSPAVNACGLSPVHGLLACAGETGLLECFDVRARSSVGCFDAAAAAGAVNAHCILTAIYQHALGVTSKQSANKQPTNPACAMFSSIS